MNPLVESKSSRYLRLQAFVNDVACLIGSGSQERHEKMSVVEYKNIVEETKREHVVARAYPKESKVNIGAFTGINEAGQDRTRL